jgi:hypothetical protein
VEEGDLAAARSTAAERGGLDCLRGRGRAVDESAACQDLGPDRPAPRREGAAADLGQITRAVKRKPKMPQYRPEVIDGCLAGTDLALDL